MTAAPPTKNAATGSQVGWFSALNDWSVTFQNRGSVCSESEPFNNGNPVCTVKASKGDYNYKITSASSGCGNGTGTIHVP